MVRIFTAFVLASTGGIAVAQAPAPPDPASASSPHQRAVTGSSEQESRPSPDDATPSAASSPHQRDAMKSSGAHMPPAEFVSKVAMDGMTEVKAAQMALQKGQSDTVKKFAQQMVTDHTKANEELMSMAAGKNLTVPTQIDADHQKHLDQLSSQSGTSFDNVYMTQMSTAHDKAIALFMAASQNTDSDISAFATKTLPTLKMHQQMIGTLQSRRMSGTQAMPDRN